MQSDNTQAALYMQRALEGSPDNLEYAADLERLLRRIPDHHCDALQVFFGFKIVVTGCLTASLSASVPSVKACILACTVSRKYGNFLMACSA